MKHLKTTFGILIFTMLVINVTSCKNKIKKAYAKEVTVENKVEAKTEKTQDYQVGSRVPNGLVCMVNDAYMGKLQIPVPVNGKTYYGCCQMCVGTLNSNETARTGIDPFSKKPIDKTEAYIVLMKASGEVAYFESEENYLKYMKAN